MDMDYMDLDHRASYRTLSKTALAEAIKQENFSEEMRVLYVALTRAKEKLILTGTVRNLQKSMEKWAETADSTGELLPVFRLRRGRNYLDWIMPALLRHPQARVLPESWEPTDRGEARQFLDEPSQWKFTFLEKGDIYGTEQENRNWRKNSRMFLKTGIQNRITAAGKRRFSVYCHGSMTMK